ncbi:FAD-binding oxidoreductase [Amycolatopsis sp. K13G38]|uniref:FAD-binding oxidoreductase n=1 Tax=Amycolatopsis acididurans TaxID=2724524 RepID=A0ABX1JD89_9PSEU|nr:FAD-dependent oxidoreductase [Amycolatopsis acididurans]NKQ57704.1 FAD-binding oxidoreductase [Amycolatopsis acididurans]
MIVLGAGLVGTSIAYALAQRGADVAVIERDEVGAGTSGRCDGNILVQTKGEELSARLTMASIELYERWHEQLPVSFHFQRCGSLMVAETERELEMLRRQVKWLRDMDVPVRLLEPGELTEREPALAKDLAGGSECMADASVYPLEAVHAIAAGATECGATIITGCAARRILRNDRGEVRGVGTSAGVFASPVVVNALGVWAPALSDTVDVPLPIRPRRGTLVVTEAVTSVITNKITEIGYVAQRYEDDGEPEREDVTLVAEPTPNGNLLLGSSREFSDFDVSVSSDMVRAIVRRAVRFIPRLERIKIIRSFSGLRPYTPGGKPIISRIEQVPGYFVAAGHEGEGVGMAPITGELTADLVCGREPRFSLSGMGVNR